jgi:UDP-3-O-[3-hydroxymyristoyl] glucosamine N-acyltransferase
VGRRLAELAELIGGRVEGDPDREIAAIQPLEAAGPADLSLYKDPRFRSRALASRAGALLVGPGCGLEGRDLLVADDPAVALSRLLRIFHPLAPHEPGIHPTAILGTDVEVDPSAHLGPYAVVGDGSRIGPRAVLSAHVVVGRRCAVGEGALLHPHVVLYDDTELAGNVEVHAGAVLGSDGFGYASSRSGHHKVPQVGRVVIESDVEIGANTTIDRATLGETRIGAGTKIDNLVQVGHNVQVGKASLLCGQSGIAGSARLGDSVVLAGQAGVSGHIELGNGVQVAAKSAALESVASGQVAGIPAIELGRWRRQVVRIANLEKLQQRLRELGRRLEQLEAVESQSGKRGDA